MQFRLHGFEPPSRYVRRLRFGRTAGLVFARCLVLSLLLGLAAITFTAFRPVEARVLGRQQRVQAPSPQLSLSQIVSVQPTKRIQAAVADANDFYYYGDQLVRLNRSVTECVVKFRAAAIAETQKFVASISNSATMGNEIRSDGRTFQVVSLASAERGITGIIQFVEQLRQRNELDFVGAVYYHPESGARMVSTDEIIVKLKPGASRQELAEVSRSLGLTILRPMRGTQDEYVLRLDAPKAADVLEKSRLLHQSGRFLWVEPNFIQEFKKEAVPNDALFRQQWHLNNTGQGGGRPGADIKAIAAWDLQRGSAAITIAVIDDGVEKTHEDLAGNIFTNPGETPGNGIDDDGNGYVDDVNGWDFSNNDNDASPSAAEDNHGTAVAGVAAARGNNGLGVSGSCQNCRILPVKISSGKSFVGNAAIAEAIRYAATFADILNNSWGGGPPSMGIQSAIQFAISRGRGGKGSVVLFATGNSATGYFAVQLAGSPAGTHRLVWEYSKDDSESDGDDTAWLGWIKFPGGQLVDFENGLPSGWTTGGSAAWSVSNDPSHADEGLCFKHALKAGSITHRQSTYVQVVRTVPAGDLLMYLWVSSEKDFDGLRFGIDLNNDGTFEFISPLQSGVPDVVSAVAYPAAHPESIAVGASSNFDCRSGYSQYGREVDFLSPSSGGPLNLGIQTIDRTGAVGYDPSNYAAAFGGTSSATPLASGVVGLILSRNPALTVAEVRQILQSTADKIGPEPYVSGRNNRYGFGRLNAFQALLAASTSAMKRHGQVTSQ